MKFEEEHRGITRQVVLVILFALACLVFLLHYKSIFGVVGSFFSALFPLFVGFFIALALYPMQNSIEHYLTSAFAGMAKRHAARAAEKQKIDIAAGASDRSPRPASEKASRGLAALASSVRRRLGRKKESGHKKSNGSSVNKSARLLSIIIAMLAVILVIVLFISVMIPQITDSYENLRVKYLDLSESITGLMESLNTGDENLLPNQLLGMIKSFISGITESLTDLTPYVLDVLKSSVSVTMDIFLGIVIAIYLLIDRERLLRVCRRLLRAVLPRKVVDRIKENSSFIFEVYNSYITGKLIDIDNMGAVRGAALAFPHSVRSVYQYYSCDNECYSVYRNIHRSASGTVYRSACRFGKVAFLSRCGCCYPSYRLKADRKICTQDYMQH